jgi:hypothetical protein
MSLSAAVIRELVAAGLTGEALVSACERIEAATPDVQLDTRTPRQKRNARYYDRKASEKRLKASYSDVSDADVLSPKKETSPEPPKEKTTPILPKANAFGIERDFFAEFWLAFPRREGSNPKKPAKLAFDRLVAKGADPERIIAAAKALAVEHPTPTRFVPQALTWLNQERFGDADPVITGDEFCADDWPNTRFLVTRFRSEKGTDPPRAIIGGKAGFNIPAEWVALSKQHQVQHA